MSDAKIRPNSNKNLAAFPQGISPLEEVTRALGNLQRADPKAYDRVFNEMTVARQQQLRAKEQNTRAEVMGQAVKEARGLPPEAANAAVSAAKNRADTFADIGQEVQYNSDQGRNVHNPGLGVVEGIASTILDLWGPEQLQKLLRAFGSNSPSSIQDVFE